MQEKSVTFSLKQWSDADKPREKLMRSGRKLLTNAELIAILIGSGSRNESAVQLAKRILSTTNEDLADLANLSVEQLMQFKGIGEAKAISIVAALEIGRRRNMTARVKQPILQNSNAVYELLRDSIEDLPHEEFWIVYLNNANKAMDTWRLSKGGITGTLVDIRLVLRKALELRAVSLILAHNHPSGSLIPSEADKNITRKLVKASKTLDIKVLDHLIITQDSYFSFADNNLIEQCS